MKVLLVILLIALLWPLWPWVALGAAAAFKVAYTAPGIGAPGIASAVVLAVAAILGFYHGRRRSSTSERP